MKKLFKSIVLGVALLTGVMFNAKETPNNLLLEKIEQKTAVLQDKILLSEEIVNDAECSYKYSYYLFVMKVDDFYYVEEGLEITIECVF